MGQAGREQVEPAEKWQRTYTRAVKQAYQVQLGGHKGRHGKEDRCKIKLSQQGVG